MGEKHGRHNAVERKTGMLRKAKCFEIIAFCSLLTSFICQNFFYDKWQERDDRLNHALELESLVDKGNLIYITNYNLTDAISGDTANMIEKAFYLEKAALKMYQSKFLVYSIYDTTREAIENNLGRLKFLADSVNSKAEYVSFIDSVNLMDMYIGDIRKESEQIKTYKPRARYIFLGLYILGAFLLFMGLRTEYLHYTITGE